SYQDKPPRDIGEIIPTDLSSTVLKRKNKDFEIKPKAIESKITFFKASSPLTKEPIQIEPIIFSDQISQQAFKKLENPFTTSDILSPKNPNIIITEPISYKPVDLSSLPKKDTLTTRRNPIKISGELLKQRLEQN